MGFLKRIFSLGSKKSKRDRQARRANQVDSNGRIVQQGDVADSEATRLLRSASAHFAEPTKSDQFLAPPHPQTSDFLSPTSSVSPVPSASSMQRRGTYNVTVHERKTEACTQFPNANPRTPDESDPLADSPLRAKSTRRYEPVTPRDQSRLTRLKQDPSVASLLNMYDADGRILSTAFSNTPRPRAPTDDYDVGGRAQTKRSGSTLRQLLGESEKDDAEAEEGDISWAERVLGENAGSTSSLASSPQIPTPPEIHFLGNPSHTRKPSVVNPPASSKLTHDRPASSSKVSLSNDEKQKTPLRAAEVFGFLTERRRSILERQRSQSQADRPISAATSSSTSTTNPGRKRSETTSNTHARKPSDTRLPKRPVGATSLTVNPDISDASSIRTTATNVQIQEARLTRVTPVVNPLSSFSTDAVNVIHQQYSSSSAALQLRPSMSSTSGIRTHRPSASDCTSGPSSSKIPRGPRAAPSRSTITYERPLAGSQQEMVEGPTLAVSSRDLQVPQKTTSRSKGPKQVPSHALACKQHRRTPSQASSVHTDEDNHISTLAPTPAPTPAKPSAYTSSAAKKSRKTEREKVQRDKENSPPSHSAAPTPPNSAAKPLRTIFDVRHPGHVNGDPPSPASSSDLSPYTKEMMVQLRRQRMRAREEMGLNYKFTGANASQGKSARRKAERMLS